MSSFTHWIEKQLQRKDKFASFNDLMFDENHIKYPLYRLSLFNFQVLFLYLVHAITFYVMAKSFSTRTFVFVIWVSSWKLILGAFWWGGLELLRSRVRQLYRVKNTDELKEAIGYWLIAASVFSIPFILTGVYFTWETITLYDKHDPFFGSAYLAISCFSVALYLFSSTYHAGIYAVTRIIRPQFSIILSHVLSLAVLLLCWKVWHYYAILASTATYGIASTCLTLYYSSYMYRLYELQPHKPDVKTCIDYARKFSLPVFASAGFANVFMNVDGLLIIAFYYFTVGSPHYFLYLKTLFLVAPLIQATSEWARLFYFDRKKLEHSQLTRFINQYEDVLRRVAGVMGLCLGCYSMIACYILISEKAGLILLVFIPVFLLRAVISNLQVHQFCSSHYFDVIISGLYFVAGFILVARLKEPLQIKSILLSILLLLGIKFLSRPRLPKLQVHTSKALYSNLYEWLHDIKSCHELVEVTRLTFDSHVQFRHKVRIIKLLTEKLELESRQITIYGTQGILFYQPVSSRSRTVSSSFFAEISYGMINRIDQDLVFTNDEAFRKSHLDLSYIDCATLREVRDKAFTYVPLNNQVVLETDVYDSFFELFPEGIVYSPKRMLGRKATPPSVEFLRKLPSYIWHFLYNHKLKSKSAYDVSALFKNGTVWAVFLVPFENNDENFSKRFDFWKKMIHAVNIKYATEEVPDQMPQDDHSYLIDLTTFIVKRLNEKSQRCQS